MATPLPPTARTIRRRRCLLAGAAAMLPAVRAGAQAGGPGVALAGILGGKALLVIDGQARPLGVGESLQGVRVVAVGPADATVEIGGRRAVLQMGGAPALVGNATPSGTGRRIAMVSDSAGHFRPQGSIDGKVTQFLVDTGATVVALGQSEAERLGLDYRSGQPVSLNTANGTAQGWRLRLSAVRIGDVTVYDVDAVVTPQPMPYVLLGNSFLTRFQMTRTNDQMVLDKRF